MGDDGAVAHTLKLMSAALADDDILGGNRLFKGSRQTKIFAGVGALYLIAVGAVHPLCIFLEQSAVIAAALTGMDQLMGKGLTAGFFGSCQQHGGKLDFVEILDPDTQTEALFGSGVDPDMRI